MTGCSTGLGAALATLISESGHQLAATSRDPSRLSFLPDTPHILKVELDVTSTSSISAAIAATVEKFGRIDVLVNNAGYGLFGDTQGIAEDKARAEFETNFWGPIAITKEAVRVFREINPKGAGGTVLQISSFGGWIGFPGGAYYYARFVETNR